jgi:hypothetical protein
MNGLRTVFRAFFVDDGAMSIFAGLIPGTLFMDVPPQQIGENPDDSIRRAMGTADEGGTRINSEEPSITPKASSRQN